MSPHAAAPLRLAVWSGPRNLSTALMRSFENRSDTIVVDEPLYAHYLAETGRDHPMRAEVIAAGERDWRRVSERLTGPLAPGVRCFYQKHMAHHLLPHVERAWLDALTHVFLIRDPRAVLASLHAKWPNPGLADTGLPQQVELFERTWSATGEAPPVVDSTELLSDPHAVLGMLCARVGLEFEDSMLEWPAGKRESDGVWAAHWYADVERSTGFGPPRTSRTKLPRSLEPLAEACEALHSRLFPTASEPMLQTFDERNADLLVNINGELVHRDEAGVSPFDSLVQGGDGVWEGLRLYRGTIFRLREHLERLRHSALALAFQSVPPVEELIAEIKKTLVANRMTDGVHIRLTLSRGTKITSGMDPRLNQAGPTLIVLAEHKPPVYDRSGLTLITSSVRRFTPDSLDPRIHHNNLLPSIMAKIEANASGADDALMLDARGFVAETNATHVFCVHRGEVQTPRAIACPEGITRATVLELCEDHEIPCRELDLTLYDFYRADEVFCSGTMGELASVTRIDGRTIGDGAPGPVTKQLSQMYRAMTDTAGDPVL